MQAQPTARPKKILIHTRPVLCQWAPAGPTCLRASFMQSFSCWWELLVMSTLHGQHGEGTRIPKDWRSWDNAGEMKLELSAKTQDFGSGILLVAAVSARRLLICEPLKELYYSRSNTRYLRCPVQNKIYLEWLFKPDTSTSRYLNPQP